jgi:hypothetical protein
MVNKKYKVVIYLKNSQEIHLYLPLNETNALVDQIYNVFSGEFDDNCIEITNKDSDTAKEVILLKADEVLYIRTQEQISDE